MISNILMIVALFSFGLLASVSCGSSSRGINVLESRNTNFTYFVNCRNASRAMLDNQDFAVHSIRGDERIPMEFHCEQLLFNNITNPYSDHDGKLVTRTQLQPQLPLKDICSLVGGWESKLGMSCENLLCGNVSTNIQSYITTETNGSTTFHDWINYCQYCSPVNQLFKKSVKSNTCHTIDEKVQRLINQFPDSILFCGYEKFGLPVLSKDDYFVCACNGFFAYKCFVEQYCPNSILELVVSYSTIVIPSLLFPITVISTYIPKIYYSIKKRSMFDIPPLTYLIGFWIVTIIEGCIENIFQKTDEMAMYALILNRGAFSLLLLSLCAWLHGWYRLVQKISNTYTLMSNILIYIVAFFFLLVLIFAIPTALIISFDVTFSKTFTSYSITISFAISLIFFGISVSINRRLKQLSDVNIYQSNFYKFVSFFAISLIIHALTNILNFFPGQNGNNSTDTLLLLVISCGIAVSELDLQLTREFYGACIKKKNSKYESLNTE